MAKFKFKIYSPYVGADIVDEVEVDIEGLDVIEREKAINEACHEWMLQTIEYGWEEIDEQE